MKSLSLMILIVKKPPKTSSSKHVSLFQSQFLGTILACLDGHSHFLRNKFPFLFVALIDAFQKPRVLKMRLIKRSTSSGVHLKSFAFMLAYLFFNVCNETLGKWPATALKVKSMIRWGLLPSSGIHKGNENFVFCIGIFRMSSI